MTPSDKILELENRIKALEDRFKTIPKAKWGKPFTVAPFEGEKTMKEWKIEESIRCEKSPNAIAMRICRGKYPDLIITRKPKLGLFVSTKQTA